MRRFEQLAKAAADHMRLLRDPMGGFQPKLRTPDEASPDSDDDARTEETLRHLRLIVDSIPAPVAVTTATGEVEFVNQLTLEYFGKTLDDLKGWSTADAVHPDDLPNVVAVWRQAVEAGNRYEVESRHRRADGVYRWFHVNGFPLRDAEGRIVRWCVLQTDIVRESMIFLRHELQSRGISVALDLAPNLPRVVGDRTQLQQVVVNLTVNAVQAMGQSEDARPGILIRTMPGDAEMACCQIEDSGPGIDPTHLPHLFDSFFTTKDSGMGMGLPISRSIIEAHGGYIRADNDSALGGARFSFALPTNGAA